ncbi:MAG: hypothetical protein JWN04_4924, partial [Myxococcaceae bacterium]|nr:hypothetical protein [Myxococcaceae bacterium]
MSIGDVDSDPPENELADASAQPPSGLELALVPRWPELSRLPPLALLAAGASLCHAVLFRLLLPLLVGQGRGLPTLLALAAPYSLNLAACAGLIALTVGTLEIVRA